jgi:hypothetical protein
MTALWKTPVALSIDTAPFAIRGERASDEACAPASACATDARLPKASHFRQ